MARAKPLNRIPPAADIRQRLAWLESEVNQLRVLLSVAEQIEAGAPDASVLAVCHPSHKHYIDRLHAAFNAADFDSFTATIEEAKQNGIALKLHFGNVTWDSAIHEIPSPEDFEAIGRDLAIKHSAEASL